MTAYVNIMEYGIDNTQGNSSTTNTPFINECIINDGLHIHDYIHVIPTSILKCDVIHISCTELSYLDGNTSNIQTQLN